MIQKKGEISFYHNGQFVAIGFNNLKKLKLYPIIDVYDANACLKFIKPKLKLKKK